MLAFQMLAGLLIGFGVCLAAFSQATSTTQFSAPASKSQSTNKVNEPAQMTAATLIGQSVGMLNNSTAFRCSSRLQVNLFGTEVVAQGSYIQAGQGGQSARLEFKYPSQPAPKTVLQICHRGYYTRFRTADNIPQLEIVDLRRIAETDSTQLVADPNAWMATGGLTSLLKNLARYFEFNPPEEAHIGETPVWRVTGLWNETRLKRLLYGQVHYNAIQNKIAWNKVPEHIPQSCEILLAKEGPFLLFPLAIRFYRTAMHENQQIRIPTIQIEMHDFERDVQFAEETFVPNFSNISRSFLTDQYVERIENLKKIQRSAQQNSPQNQTR